MANATLNAGVIYYGGWWGPIMDGMLIPPDSVVRIEPNWINNGSIPLTGHLSMTMRYTGEEPSPVELEYGQDKTLAGGESTSPNNPYFADILLREGICAFEISLTIDGVDAGKQNFALIISGTLTPNQIRIPLEMQKSPLEITINPTEVYGHVGAYLYRILPMPINISLTFRSNGISYVEVIDSDTYNKETHMGRWLLAEKTPIYGDTTFDIDWDGRGVFEPRVWLEDCHLTGISIAFDLPKEEDIPRIKANFNWAPYVLAGGITLGVFLGLPRKGTKKRVR